MRSDKPWLTLAYRELAMGFSRAAPPETDEGAKHIGGRIATWWRSWSRPVPGGRDFRSLTAVSALVMASIALSMAFHRGVVINFADSLVGYFRGDGVPIGVMIEPAMARTDSGETVYRFFRNGRALTQPNHLGSEVNGLSGLIMDPYSPIDEIYPHLKLPGAGEDIGARIWRRKPVAREIRGEFEGWAVRSDGALWRWARAPANIEAFHTIVLNRSAFRSSFDLDAYAEALKAHLPVAAVEAWRMRQPAADQLDSFFLRVPLQPQDNEARRIVSQLTEFRVVWVESFPTPKQITFLVAAETLRAIDLAGSYRDIGFSGRLGDAQADRVFHVNVDIGGDFKQEEVKTGRIAALRACLGANTIQQSMPNGISLILATPVPESWVNLCRQQIGITESSDLFLEVGSLRGVTMVRPGVVTVPCPDPDARQQEEWTKALLAREQAKCAERPAPPNVEVSAFPRAWEALIFAPTRDQIRSTLEIIKNYRPGGDATKVPPFTVGESYETAIKRFTYLTDTLTFLTVPLAIFCLFVVVYVMNFQFITLIEHRRQHYGILLTRGLTWIDIYKMVVVQVVLATTIAFVGTVVLVEGAKWLLAISFVNSGPAMLGRTELGILEPEITSALDFSSAAAFRSSLSESLGLLVVAFSMTLVLNVGLVMSVMWRKLPLRPRSAPSSLMTA